MKVIKIETLEAILDSVETEFIDEAFCLDYGQILLRAAMLKKIRRRVSHAQVPDTDLYPMEGIEPIQEQIRRFINGIQGTEYKITLTLEPKGFYDEKER